MLEKALLSSAQKKVPGGYKGGGREESVECQKDLEEGGRKVRGAPADTRGVKRIEW